ncbi:MAG: class III cytochrome C family protein [Sphingomonadales bacterium]|nr:class III cytochrome C family protein [Sphingomonadales bacterium]
MTRRHLLIFMAALVAGLVWWSFVSPQTMVAPGPVIPGHATIANDCFACHTAFRGTSAAKCETCHTLDKIGITTSKGKPLPRKPGKTPFHGKLAQADCLACHSDHAGPLLVRSRTHEFDHSLLKPAAAQTCAACHSAPKTAVHEGLKGQCATCHNVQGWTPASFDHDRYFRLDGDHNVACTTCHVKNNFKRYTCYGCHEHSEARVIAEHHEEGIRKIEDCARCHRRGEGEEHGGEGHNDRKGDDD